MINRKLATLLCVSILAASVGGAGAAELVVSQVAPSSGSQAQRGPAVAIGAKIYFDFVNSQGGIYGAKLRLVSRDDGYKVEETIKQVKDAIEKDNPIALFCPTGSSNVEALVKENVLSGASLPVVGVCSGPYSLHAPVVPWLFHTRAHYRAETEKMVEHLASAAVTRVAVFYQDDGFGRDGLAGVEGAVTKYKVQLVTKATFERNTTNVADAVKTIASVNPQAVIMVSNTAPSANFVKQFRAAGGTAQLLAVSVTDGQAVAKEIGPEVARGLAVAQVLPNPHKQALALTREFHQLLEKFGPKNTNPSYSMLEGFVNAKVLVEALRRGGPNPTREKLLKTLESMSEYDLGGYGVGFSRDNHTGSRFVELSIVGRDGQLMQ